MTIVIQINAPLGSEQAVKEALAMYCERFGDCRVVEERDLPGFDLDRLLLNVNTPADYRRAEKISNSSLQ